MTDEELLDQVVYALSLFVEAILDRCSQQTIEMSAQEARTLLKGPALLRAHGLEPCRPFHIVDRAGAVRTSFHAGGQYFRRLGEPPK